MTDKLLFLFFFFSFFKGNLCYHQGLRGPATYSVSMLFYAASHKERPHFFSGPLRGGGYNPLNHQGKDKVFLSYEKTDKQYEPLWIRGQGLPRP